MARRKLPKFDLCKLRPDRFRSMSDDQLMRVWARLGASAPSHKKLHQTIKALVSNLAAAKSSQRMYANDPEQRKQSWSIYTHNLARYEQEIYDMQAKAGCKIPGDEQVARDAEREGRPRDAARLRRKAHIR